MSEAEGPTSLPEPQESTGAAPEKHQDLGQDPDKTSGVDEPGLRPSAPRLPQLSTWARDLVLLLSIAGAGASLAWILSVQLVETPEVFVQVRTWGVHFALTPDSARDLVRFSRPRQGLTPDGRPYSGIPIRDLNSAPVSDFVAAFGGETTMTPRRTPCDELGSEPPTGTRNGVIQEFSVTPGCSVWLEPWLAGAVQIGVHATSADGPPCRARARVFLDSAALDIPPTTVTIDRSLLVRFTPDGDLRFENLPVASFLRFDAHNGVELGSGVIGGEFRLTGWEEEVEGLYPGDPFSLGEVSGRITELHVSDALDVVFRGTASDPRLGSRSLSMSKLEAAWRRYGEQGTILGVAVTVLLVGSATLQAIRRG